MYTAIFKGCKNDNFLDEKNLLILAQNIDCGYTLEPPQKRQFKQVVLGKKKTTTIIVNFYSCQNCCILHKHTC